MARQTQVEELRSVNPATLEEVGSVAVSPPEEVAEAVTEARLAARALGASRRSPSGARCLSAGRAGRARRSGRSSQRRSPPRPASRSSSPTPPSSSSGSTTSSGRPPTRAACCAPSAFAFAAAPATQARLAALRAPRRRRGDLAVELPARDPAHAGGLRGSGRERGRRQAVRADAALWWVGGGALPPSGRAEGARARRPGRAGDGRGARARARHRRRSCSRARVPSAGRSLRRRESGCGLSRSSSAARTRCSSSRTPTSTARSPARSGAAFSNCGQVCSAVERIYVAQPLQEAFAEELVRRVRDATAGSRRASSRPSSGR